MGKLIGGDQGNSSESESKPFQTPKCAAGSLGASWRWWAGTCTGCGLGLLVKNELS